MEMFQDYWKHGPSLAHDFGVMQVGVIIQLPSAAKDGTEIRAEEGLSASSPGLC